MLTYWRLAPNSRPICWLKAAASSRLINTTLSLSAADDAATAATRLHCRRVFVIASPRSAERMSNHLSGQASCTDGDVQLAVGHRQAELQTALESSAQLREKGSVDGPQLDGV